MEEWKNIKGYEGLYQVSNTGKVRRIFKRKTKELKLVEDKDGYFYVKLSKESMIKHFRINRLVLLTFNPIKNPSSKQVNHIDGNKKNNNLQNLEWCTQKENLSHALQNNLINSRKVKCIETDIIYYSLREAGRKTNSNFRKISECCQGLRNKTNNYHWEYV